MRTIFAVSLILAVTGMAQEPPPTPDPPAVVRVQGASVIISPVTVSLLNVVVAVAGNPDELRIVLSQLTVPQLASIVLGLASRPDTLKVVLAQMSPQQVGGVILALGSNPDDLKSLLAQLTPAQLAAAVPNQILKSNPLIEVIAPALDLSKPDDLKLLLAQPAPAQLTAAVPDQILKPSPRIEVTVPALDLSRWIAVRELTDELNTYGGNWLGSAAEHLRKRIATEGYSDGVMAEFQQLKERLSRPAINTP